MSEFEINDNDDPAIALQKQDDDDATNRFEPVSNIIGMDISMCQIRNSLTIVDILLMR